MEPLTGTRQQAVSARSAAVAIGAGGMGFAERLRALMIERGMSTRKVARAVPCDPGYVSKLTTGARQPSAEMAQRLDEILAAGGELLTLARPMPPVPVLAVPAIVPDPDLLDRITKATGNPARVDVAVVEWLERTLAEHRRVEDSVGSAPLMGIVRGQLNAVAGFTRSAQGRLADRLVGLASQYAQFLAWMCIESRNHAIALTWYDRAHDWAVQADDASMAATALSMKAHLAWSTGDAQRCVRMAGAARWHGGRVSPGVQGMAAQMAARGYALAGQADPAHALLREAQELIRQAAARPEDEPPWMYFYGEDWFTLQRGMAELHLRNWQGAARMLAAGLTALPSSYRRDRAWYGACLAHAHAGAGDAEQAESVAVGFAADIADVNGYARTELLTTARLLSRKGARNHGSAITEALAAHDR